MQCEWDLDRAYEALRKKGLAAAAKKASRHASEGLVGLAVRPLAGAAGASAASAAAVVEVNSETDFVARNELFQGLVGRAAAAALELGARHKHQQGAPGAAELDANQVGHAMHARDCPTLRVGSWQAWLQMDWRLWPEQETFSSDAGQLLRVVSTHTQ